MKKTILKSVLIGVLAGLSVASGAAMAEEYIYRDLMGNTLPSPKCAERSEASANATDPYLIKKKEKVFCETQGYGWHVAERKNSGNLVCEECSGEGNKGKYQCHVEDIVVACKRLKPGSVGMLPGKR